MTKLHASQLFSTHPVLVLEFANLPSDLQSLFDVGGDEDVVILVPEKWGSKQMLTLNWLFYNHPHIGWRSAEMMMEELAKTNCKVEIEGQCYFWYTVCHG